MSVDVIVVGGGWGGLTAGAMLARNGLEVRLLEASGHLGGRASCERKDGFIVDYGIHAISHGSAGAAARALCLVGHEIEFLHYGKPLLYREGGFAPLPTGAYSILSSRHLSPADKLTIARGFGRLLLSNTEKTADVPIVESVPGADRETVRDFYSVLSGIGLIAPDIEVASSGEFARFLKRALKARHQVAYPRGGSAQINEALAARVESSGGVSTNSRVKRLEIEGGLVRSLKVLEEDLSARAYVLAVPVQKIPDLVGDALGGEFKRSCSSIIPTAGLSLDLCLSRPVSDIDSVIITANPVTMGQFTSNIDESTAPAGKQLATFFYPLPVSLLEDRVRLEEESKRFVALVEEMFPGILDRVEWERTLKLKMIDGFEPRVGQTPRDRPGTRVEGAENLFLARDCVGVEGQGGDVAFTSGVRAAEAVLEYLG